VILPEYLHLLVPILTLAVLIEALHYFYFVDIRPFSCRRHRPFVQVYKQVKVFGSHSLTPIVTLASQRTTQPPTNYGWPFTMLPSCPPQSHVVPGMRLRYRSPSADVRLTTCHVLGAINLRSLYYTQTVPHFCTPSLTAYLK